MSNSGKLKILYFTPGEKYKTLIVPNNLEPIIERVDIWLNHFFDLVTIEEECDLIELVKKHNPDGILYDGLIEGTHSLDFEIKNNSAHPNLPRAGLSRVDAISPSRGICVERLMMLGAKAIFQLGDTILGEAFKDIKSKLYYTPWFFNPDLFKDYKETKRIPVVLFGSFDGPPYTYPWRTSVRDMLINNFPTLYFKHPGYSMEGQADIPVVLYGEKYARTLNASYIAPSSGGFTDIVISKQLEIPASRTLLVTNDVPAVHKYGFEANKNCMMADSSDIATQVKYALLNQRFLEEVTDAGYNMVHAKHTYKQRPQIYQWFELQKGLGKRRIIQPDLFADLKVVDQDSPSKTYHMMGCPLHALLEKTDTALRNGNWQDLEVNTMKLLNYCPYLGEPKLRSTIAYLAQGRVKEGMKVITDVITLRFNFGGVVPDPIEWGVFLLALVCTKDLESIKSQIEAYPDLVRYELNIVSWLIALMINNHELALSQANKVLYEKNNHMSMHSFNNFGFEDIFDALRVVLTACGLKPLIHVMDQARPRYGL